MESLLTTGGQQSTCTKTETGPPTEAVTTRAETVQYAYAPGRYERSTETTTVAGQTPVERAYGYDETTRRLATVIEAGDSPEAGATYQYDAAGNVERVVSPEGSREYDHDALNQLTSVSVTDGIGTTTELYAFDHAGRRVTRTLSSTAIEAVYAGDTMVAEYADTGTPTTAYHGLGKPAAVDDLTGGETARQHYLYGALGTVQGLSDPSGALAVGYQIDAFGRVGGTFGGGEGDAPAPTPNRRGFTGHWHDPSGLVHMGARSYEPGTGLFLSVDPHSGFQDKPFSLLGYQYAYGNPGRYVDPSGETVWGDAMGYLPGKALEFLDWAPSKIEEVTGGPGVPGAIAGWASGPAKLGWSTIAGTIAATDAVIAIGWASGGEAIERGAGIAVPGTRRARQDVAALQAATDPALFAAIELAMPSGTTEHKRGALAAENTVSGAEAWLVRTGEGVARGDARASQEASAALTGAVLGYGGLRMGVAGKGLPRAAIVAENAGGGASAVPLRVALGGSEAAPFGVTSEARLATEAVTGRGFVNLAAEVGGTELRPQMVRAGTRVTRGPPGAGGGATARRPRLPTDGTWTGVPGDSEFIPNNASVLSADRNVVNVAPGTRIPFRGGDAVFDRFAWDEFTVQGLTGGRGDRRLMLEGLASRYGMTRQEAAAYVQERFFALHHAGGDRVQLIPGGIHGWTCDVAVGVPHRGAASALRRQ